MAMSHIEGADYTEDQPLIGAHFALDLGGVVEGYFTEVTGLGSETETVEHKVVNKTGQEVVMKIPGRLKWENIVLKRGITKSMDIWAWRKRVESGDVEGARLDGSVIMFNQQLDEVARWNFQKGWPSKVSGPTPKSDGNEVAMEELTIVHEYIERVT
jgi:phage tail-like protein